MDKHINEVGTMVIDPRGRVGMVDTVLLRSCKIMYGSAGPYATILKKNLRVATVEEIRNAGLEGVGRKWPPDE